MTSPTSAGVLHEKRVNRQRCPNHRWEVISNNEILKQHPRFSE